MDSVLSAAGAIAACLLAVALVRLAARPLAGLLVSAGAVNPNFRGHPVPFGAGLALLLAVPPALALGAAAGAWLAGRAGDLAAGLLAGGLLGAADDWLGSPVERGLRGHWRAACAGRLSAGGLKVLVGVSVAAWGWLRFGNLAAAVLLPLGGGVANLLDVRPGRAAKAALLLLTPLLPHWPPPVEWVLFTATLAYLPEDLRGRAMLGDLGAHALGVAVAGAWASRLGPGGSLAACGALLLVHVAAEFTPLSALIERVPLLRRLDRLGQNDSTLVGDGRGARVIAWGEGEQDLPPPLKKDGIAGASNPPSEQAVLAVRLCSAFRSGRAK